MVNALTDGRVVDVVPFCFHQSIIYMDEKAQGFHLFVLWEATGEELESWRWSFGRVESDDAR